MIEYPNIGRRYKHYKGGLYDVISLATHTETEEIMVVYKSVHFGSIYVRPLSMWFEVIKLLPNGKDLRRFEPI